MRPETKTKILIAWLALLTAVLCVGCNGVTERQSYALSSQTYQTTVGVIADLYDAGKIDADDHAKAKAWDNIAFAALEAWHEALINDMPVAEAVGRFTEAMRELEKLEGGDDND